MFTPSNIKKLTNVSIISIKKNSKKFELALYPNKLHDFRIGLKTQLSEILHTNQIFKNVSKGELASKEELSTNFPKKTNDEIIKEILTNGTEKKCEKTRLYELENKEKEIVNIIKKKLIDSSSNKFLNENRIRDLFKKHKISIDLRREAKVQANEIIKIVLNDKEDSMKYRRQVIKVEILNGNNILDERWKSCIDIIQSNSVKYYNIGCDEFKEFKIYCDCKGISYTIIQNDDIQEEIIC